MVIIIPAVVCVIWKVWAMSVSRPMGINSEVLKIKAAIVIPISGSPCFLFLIKLSFKKTYIILAHVLLKTTFFLSIIYIGDKNEKNNLDCDKQCA